MTPTVLGAERSRAGADQFGWLKTLSQCQSRRSFGMRGFSDNAMDFSKAACQRFSPGPTTVSRAEFPNLPLPAGGAAKAGPLTIWNVASGAVETRWQLVHDQSLVTLTATGDLIVGGTTVIGGGGSHPTEREAKLFIWDTRTKQKISKPFR